MPNSGRKVEAGMSNEQFYQAMDEMVALLGDEHSDFYTPEEVATRRLNLPAGGTTSALVYMTYRCRRAAR